MIVSTMLSEGFQLVTRLRQRLHLLDGWTATIIDGTPVLMTITTGSGGLFYDGTAIPPDGWLNAARDLGWCAVYGGAVQMPDHGSAGKGTRVLQAAAVAGGLVGARVAVETR